MTYDEFERQLRTKLVELNNPDNTGDTSYIEACFKALQAIQELKEIETQISVPLGKTVA